MKWSFPHFDYNGIMCGMAAFTQHCALGFWKGSLVVRTKAADSGMGQVGRIASIKDLPDEKTLTSYVRAAAELNLKGVRGARPIQAAKAKAVAGSGLFASGVETRTPLPRRPSKVSVQSDDANTSNG